MDVCPVGAITTRDYRFKSRPWDNPFAADTICTQCAKGCNVTAWIKAKPEWAKGSRLIRFTPRFNPDVNGYWMCDIGRFEYHWIEGDDRLMKPLVKRAMLQQPLSWHDAMRAAARTGSPAAGADRQDRAMASALPAVRARVARRAVPVQAPDRGAARRGRSEGDRRQLAISRRSRSRRGAKFKVPAVDAPNVNGARMLGLVPGASATRWARPIVRRCAQAVEGGRVSALYVFDPGPEGSLGDTSVDCRRAQARRVCRCSIVQGVLLTELARAADFVLPGASYVEKEASYTNRAGTAAGHVARDCRCPATRMEDWQISSASASALGVPFDYTSAARRPRGHRRALPERTELAGIDGARRSTSRCEARNWLQASNPSERWKWDFMFQDLPPVKGAVDTDVAAAAARRDSVEGSCR